MREDADHEVSVVGCEVASGTRLGMTGYACCQLLAITQPQSEPCHTGRHQHPYCTLAKMLECIKLVLSAGNGSGKKPLPITIFPSYLSGDSVDTYFWSIMSMSGVSQAEVNSDNTLLKLECSSGDGTYAVLPADRVQTMTQLRGWFNDGKIPFDMTQPLSVSKIKGTRRPITSAPAPSVSRSGCAGPTTSTDDAAEKSPEWKRVCRHWLHITDEMKSKAFSGIRPDVWINDKKTALVLKRFALMPEGAYYQRHHLTALKWLHHQVFISVRELLG